MKGRDSGKGSHLTGKTTKTTLHEVKRSLQYNKYTVFLDMEDGSFIVHIPGLTDPNVL